MTFEVPSSEFYVDSADGHTQPKRPVFRQKKFGNPIVIIAAAGAASSARCSDSGVARRSALKRIDAPRAVTSSRARHVNSAISISTIGEHQLRISSLRKQLQAATDSTAS